MKRYSLLGIIGLALLFCISCQKDIPLKNDTNLTRLELSGWLRSDTSFNCLQLALVNQTRGWKPQESTVTLSVNGGAKIPLKKIIINDSSTDNTLEKAGEKIGNARLQNRHSFDLYEVATLLHADDKIHIEASAENGRFHAEVDFTMPPQHLETMTVEFSNNAVGPHRTDIHLQQQSDRLCYYKLGFKEQIRQHIQIFHLTDQIRAYDSSEESDQPDYSDDIALNDGNINQKNSDDLDLFDRVENRELVFTSQFFTDRSYSMKVSGNRSSNLYYSLIADLENKRTVSPEELEKLINEKAAEAVSFQVKRYDVVSTIEVMSLSRQSYFFLRKVNALLSSFDDDDDMTKEPIMPDSNVKGGIGYVGGLTVKKQIIQHTYYTTDLVRL